MSEQVELLAAVAGQLLVAGSVLALYLRQWRRNRSIRDATVAVRIHTRRC